jgi:TP901 family phage tail tape measure protein
MGLGFDFVGRDFVSPTMGGIRRQFGLTEGASKKLAKSVGAGFVMLTAGALTTAVALGGLGGAINLANQAGQFEQEMAAVGAITRATAKDMNTLETAAINAGIATQFSPKEAAEGLRNLGQMGFNAVESAKALVPALDFAAGGQISVAAASQTAASALRVFGLETDDAALTVDKLLRISNVTALKAADLELAIGNLGRGVGLTKQSIDEMLPSLGLVKNTGVEASTAASSVSSALLFMSKNSKKFKNDLGVNITDAAGNFRPFMEVVLDASNALGSKYKNAAERAATAQKLFGRFGITAYTAISEQLTKGIRTSTGETLKGAAAMNYLREQMRKAGGAAAEFREKLLETFEGQKTLLRGTLETMAVVFGKPFAAVFKPFVNVLTNSLNAVIRFFNALPKPVQNAIAGITVAVLVITAALGAMLTVAGAITILLPFMSTFIMVLKAMALAAGGVVVVVAALAAGFALAVWLVRNNIGGIGDAFNKATAKIKLFWNGLIDLFTKGGFSEAVSKEMGKAENKGIRTFAIRFFQIFYRIKRFFKGIAEGFRDVMEEWSPVFGALGEAFKRLGEAVGGLGLDVLGFAGTPSDKFNEAGYGIGAVIGGLINIIAILVTGLVEAFTWIIKIGSWLGDTFAKYVIIAQETMQSFADTLKNVWEWLVKIGSSAIGKVVSFFTGEESVTATQPEGTPTAQAKTPFSKPAPGRARAIAPSSLAPAGTPMNLEQALSTMSAREVAEKLSVFRADTAAGKQDIERIISEIKKNPTVVSLNIDGTRVGEAVASAQRSKLARQGVPVGEEAV